MRGKRETTIGSKRLCKCRRVCHELGFPGTIPSSNSWNLAQMRALFPGFDLVVIAQSTFFVNKHEGKIEAVPLATQ